jgi:hypothetical protein
MSSIKVKKQRIIGKQRFINEATGEVIDAIVVEKNVEQDYGWYKVWLLDLLGVLELVGTKKMKVITYILENMRRDNIFIGTHTEIAKKLGISRVVVSQTFKILLDANFLVKRQNGVYMLNPDIVAKVNSHYRASLLVKYAGLKNNGE